MNMNLPKIEAWSAYRYMPTKDEPDNYIEFLCIRVHPDGTYLAMILYDHSVEHPFIDKPWDYGDLKVLDWNIEIEQMNTLECDIVFAKMMAL
jgi:hypothetical protein